ncbi:DUF5611 family protein [Thermoplasmatales archaeon AK]|nr:DUF5611 family protein [Thermoplasmatales archaeon AK]
MVREYPVKKGYKMDLGSVLAVVKTFSGDARIEGDSVVASLPGLRRIEIRSGKATILVSTETDSKSEDPLRTVKLYNDLIEKITGFSAKERKKKLTKV